MLTQITGDRWVAFGAAVLAAGVAVGLVVWQSHPTRGYWHAPGIAAVTVAGLGLVMMLRGLVKRDKRNPPESAISQTQVGGAHSVNVQAGRDVRVGRSEDEASRS